MPLSGENGPTMDAGSGPDGLEAGSRPVSPPIRGRVTLQDVPGIVREAQGRLPAGFCLESIMHHIVILVDEQDGHEDTGYFLLEMARLWRDNGMRVTVVDNPACYVEADLAILHVNLTVVPDSYMALIRRYPRALNARVRDISKRSISANLVSPGDDYCGPVIVKTNRNYGGKPEKRKIEKKYRLIAYYNAVRKKLARVPALKQRLEPDYAVYRSVGQIPGRIWNNPGMVVERFLPERHEDLYCLRTWVFMGDRETNSICYSREPVIKSGNIIHREMVADVPHDLREKRRTLGFDFGKFDYAIVDGRTVLYDVNRTPSLGSFSAGVSLMPGIRLLAQGVHAYL